MYMPYAGQLLAPAECKLILAMSGYIVHAIVKKVSTVGRIASFLQGSCKKT